MATRKEIEDMLEEALDDEAEAASRVAFYIQQLEEGDYDDTEEDEELQDE